MSNILNYEKGILHSLTRIADVVALGVLWVMCSIPVITMGASSTAMYYAYQKCIRQKRGYAWKEFFVAFKENFSQATKIWLFVLAMLLMAGVDFYVLYKVRDSFPIANTLMAIFVAVVAIVVIWGLYLFPYIARFEMANKDIMKNCILIALANFLWSALLLLLFVAVILLFVFVPVIGLLLPGMYIIIANLILEHVFRKYMSPEDLEKQKEFES